MNSLIWISKYQALLGMFLFLLIAVFFSKNRTAIPWRIIFKALGLQGIIVVIMFFTPFGQYIFRRLQQFFEILFEASYEGAGFAFGELTRNPELGAFFAFRALPLIIVVAAFMNVLIYLKIIDNLVSFFSAIFRKFLKLSGFEAFTSGLLIFLGIDCFTGLKKYLLSAGQREIFFVMVVFLSTIAGGVMATYISFGVSAGHLLSASVMSLPAALIFSRILYPTQEALASTGDEKIRYHMEAHNPIDAFTRGALEGLKLALNVGALVIAFLSGVFFINILLGFFDLSLSGIFSRVFFPMALGMGIPFEEAADFSILLGMKVTMNEFIAYLELQNYIQMGLNSPLSERSITIATYALCGFANFGSIAIIIGGISTLAPNQRRFATTQSFRALLGGVLTSFFTASFISLFI